MRENEDVAFRGLQRFAFGKEKGVLWVDPALVNEKLPTAPGVVNQAASRTNETMQLRTFLSHCGPWRVKVIRFMVLESIYLHTPGLAGTGRDTGNTTLPALGTRGFLRLSTHHAFRTTL